MKIYLLFEHGENDNCHVIHPKVWVWIWKKDIYDMKMPHPQLEKPGHLPLPSLRGVAPQCDFTVTSIDTAVVDGIILRGSLLLPKGGPTSFWLFNSHLSDSFFLPKKAGEWIRLFSPKTDKTYVYIYIYIKWKIMKDHLGGGLILKKTSLFGEDSRFD